MRTGVLTIKNEREGKHGGSRSGVWIIKKEKEEGKKEKREKINATGGGGKKEKRGMGVNGGVKKKKGGLTSNDRKGIRRERGIWGKGSVHLPEKK